MNICKTCKYWLYNPRAFNYIASDLSEPLDPDTYELMDRTFETRICKHPQQTFCEPPVINNGFALADGSTYIAVLATAENFGCVLHMEIAHER